MVKSILRIGRRDRPQEGNQVKFRVNAHHRAGFSQPNRDPLRQRVTLIAMAGAGTHGLLIRLRFRRLWVLKVRYRRAASSCLFSGLYICLLGLSARMGRPKRLADHDPVQLP